MLIDSQDVYQRDSEKHEIDAKSVWTFGSLHEWSDFCFTCKELPLL